KIENRIIGASHPHRGASRLPGVTSPGFVAGFTWSWDGVEMPNFLTGVGVIGSDKTSDAKLTTCRAHEDLVFDNQWRVRDRIGGPCVRYGRLPEWAPIFGIDGDQMRIQGSQKKSVT